MAVNQNGRIQNNLVYKETNWQLVVKINIMSRFPCLLQRCLRACLHGNILSACGCSDTIDLDEHRCRISNITEGKNI